MREVPLSAVPRDARGKGAARRSRQTGDIPAVVYGPEIQPIPIAVSEKALRQAMKESAGATSIYDLEVDGNHNKVLIRDIQRDPITSKIIHIDFHAISMTKPISVAVPFKFVGTPRGVKTDGGIMQTTMRQLEISCLPTDIPEAIEVDVEDLGIGDAIHVHDLQVPSAEIRSELRRTVVVIAAPTVMKVAATAAEGEEEGVEEAAEGAEVAEGAEEGEAEEGKDKGKE